MHACTAGSAPGDDPLPPWSTGCAGSGQLKHTKTSSVPTRILTMASSGTKLNFNEYAGGSSYSAKALRKAVVARGATLTELDLR